MLVILQGSRPRWGVNQPATSYYLSHLSRNDLGSGCDLSRATGVGCHGFESTDSVGVVSYERFTVFCEGAQMQVWGQIQVRVVVMVCHKRRSLDFNLDVALPKPYIHHIFEPVNVFCSDLQIDDETYFTFLWVDKYGDSTA